MNPAGRTFNVIVEGNIGSGKTTFLKHFKAYEDVCVLEEPVDMWRDCNGHNLLGLMYNDIHRWGFSFQSYVLLTMLKQHTKETNKPVRLMERSLYSARYCFIENMYNDGFISGPSAAVLDEYYNWIVGNTAVDVDLIVYLRSTPEIVHKRMLERNRDEEKCVSLEYLERLHARHENWLLHKTHGCCPAPVVVINADLDKVTICEEYKKYEQHVLNKNSISTTA